jgi:hypothetical protein
MAGENLLTIRDFARSDLKTGTRLHLKSRRKNYNGHTILYQGIGNGGIAITVEGEPQTVFPEDIIECTVKDSAL